MSAESLISPCDLRDFAKARGWKPVPEALQDGLIVLNSPRQDYRQIIVPSDQDQPDFADALRISLRKLAEAEEKSVAWVEARLLEAACDTWQFGVSTRWVTQDGLPLSYAVRAIKGVESAFRAAACSEVHRKPFHPKMNRAEAQRLVEAAQMRHTESGSFVLKAGCPIDAIPSEGTEGSPVPFARRAMLGMSDAVRDLVGAVASDQIDKLVERAQKDGESPLSANLCDGLMAFQYEDLRAALDLSVTWSPRLEAPPEAHLKPIRIPWDYFPRIDQVRVALRPAQKTLEETFVGLVDELKGDLGPGDERVGEVILRLFLEEESVRARVDLAATDHHTAIEAYQKGMAYVKVTGKLHPGNQPRRLTDVTQFSLVSP